MDVEYISSPADTIVDREPSLKKLSEDDFSDTMIPDRLILWHVVGVFIEMHVSVRTESIVQRARHIDGKI